MVNGAASTIPRGGRERPLDMTSLGGFKALTDFANCLLPLLDGLGWRGEPRHVVEALPHSADSLDLAGLRDAMANLRFKSRPVRVSLRRLDPRLMPCLYVPDGKAATVVLRRDSKSITIYDGETAQERVLPRRANWHGTAYVFTKVDPTQGRPVRAGATWFGSLLDRFRPLFYQVLGVTFLLNILALSVPLFIMTVYDQVVTSGSEVTLRQLVAGVILALCFDLVLRNVRARILGFIGGRLDNLVGNAVFERIMYLPPVYTERATVGSQVSRIKDFETLRDFLTGPMLLALFELPFTVIFVMVLALLGGTIALVPLSVIGLYFVLTLVINPLIKEAYARAAQAGSRRQEFVVEAVSNLRAVRYSGAQRVWLNRFKEYAAESAMRNFELARYNALVHTLSHVLMISAGLVTVSYGVFKVVGGSMTVGGLVAAMILVWRVLAPLQAAFVSLNRIEQLMSSARQINNLMKLKVERETSSHVGFLRRIQGRVTFSRVSLRYRQDSDPSLMGVSFDVQPGQVLAIIGANGSGKSTILKLINGLYAPQGGNVRIDGTDIRQIDPVELRFAIGYVPQTTQLFYGTIAQNLRLAGPTATDDELREAAAKAGLLDDILNLKTVYGKTVTKGFDARIGDFVADQLSSSFRQRMNLTRAYLGRSPIMLFDEPVSGLDRESDQAFLSVVDSLKGESTVILVTHRPSHLTVADQILWLDQGIVRMYGPAEQLRGNLPRNF